MALAALCYPHPGRVGAPLRGGHALRSSSRRRFSCTRDQAAGSRVLGCRNHRNQTACSQKKQTACSPRLFSHGWGMFVKRRRPSRKEVVRLLSPSAGRAYPKMDDFRRGVTRVERRAKGAKEAASQPGTGDPTSARRPPSSRITIDRRRGSGVANAGRRTRGPPRHLTETSAGTFMRSTAVSAPRTTGTGSPTRLRRSFHHWAARCASHFPSNSQASSASASSVAD